MSNKNIYRVCSLCNILILFVVIFTSYKYVGAVIGILFLLLTILIGRRIQRDKSRIKSVHISSVIIKYDGLEALLFGLMGLHSMLKIAEQFDIVWFYYLIFNCYVISVTYVRVIKKEKNNIEKSK